MSKYEKLALEMGAVNAKMITFQDLVLDPRVYLKCIGCAEYGTWSCHPNLPKFNEAQAMLSKYEEILIIHGHNKNLIGSIARTIEKEAFLDGNYFSFAMCGCYFCKKCRRSEEGPCVNPDYRRPYCYSLGIDIYKTAVALDLPIQVLRTKDDEENRYAFVLIK